MLIIGNLGKEYNIKVIIVLFFYFFCWFEIFLNKKLGLGRGMWLINLYVLGLYFIFKVWIILKCSFI